MKHLLLVILCLPLLGARLFDDANPDYLETDTAVVTAAPFSVSAWVRADDLTNRQNFFFVGDKDSTTDFWTGQIDDSVGADGLEWEFRDGGGGSDASTLIGTINVWHHFCGIEASATDHRALADGGNKATTATSRSPAGADRTAIGRRGDSTPSREFSGDIAHVAVYNIALSDEECAILAAGVSPLRVHRDSLIAYWPCNGQSPEYEIMGSGINLTVSGTPSVTEEPPPFFSPIVAP